jgi:hypothetical protein
MRSPSQISQVLDFYVPVNLFPFDRLMVTRKLLLFQDSAFSIQLGQPEHPVRSGDTGLAGFGTSSTPSTTVVRTRAPIHSSAYATYGGCRTNPKGLIDRTQLGVTRSQITR